MTRIDSTSAEAFRAQLDGEISRRHGPDEARRLRDFARIYFQKFPLDDFAEHDLADVYACVQFWWKWLARRDPSVAGVEVFNPGLTAVGWESRRTIIAVAQREMPFLLDSIRLALNRRGHTVFILHTCSFDVARDPNHPSSKLCEIPEQGSVHSRSEGVRVSTLYLEVDRLSDPDACRALARTIEGVIEDVELVVEDFDPMQRRVREILQDLEKDPPECVPGEEVREARKFLEWLLDDHFTFLGMTEVERCDNAGAPALREVSQGRLGLLRKRPRSRPVTHLSEMNTRALNAWMDRSLLGFSKSSRHATVHRDVYSDYVTLKCFDEDADVSREYRLMGLYTSTVYTESPFNIPVIRRKLETLRERAGLARGGHEASDLQHVLESHPRDELFQADDRELAKTTLAIARIQDRKQVRLFVRRDRHGKFFSCLVYVPRDVYDTQLRREAERILCETFSANECEFTTHLSDSVLARTHFILRTLPDQDPVYDVEEIRSRIAAIAKSWSESLAEALIEELGESDGENLSRAYARSFPASYRDDFVPRVAIDDIVTIEGLADASEIGMRFSRGGGEPCSRLRFKLFHFDEILTLSNVIPILENLGVQVIGENPYRIRRSDGRCIWIQDFELDHQTGTNRGESVALTNVEHRFPDAFESVWQGRAENDGFNRLVLASRLPWREVAILRAYARYMKQITIHFSLQYIAETLSNHPAIAEDLVALFHAHFDPDENRYSVEAKHNQERIEEQLSEALDRVENLDEDRIFRRFIDLIRATLRTNFHQRDGAGRVKEHLSFKLSPRDVPGVPEPCPRYEIFVYSPRVEGVHLRGGRVARGGIRWSDRLEDYRTEVLGLVKAQQVKNAVIVPVGAKGGFVTRRVVSDASRDELQAEAIACYQIFIRGLLDLTDNRSADRIIRPEDGVCKDEEDPYLVVAADKGTATFSDIANRLSREYGFWLGDAFASGGSVGYDHKKMGITAKGAWVSIERHFRECGIDVSSQPFSVVGIGDMSGDVFGNGMLLSPHIELIAAFNHASIFIDPKPLAELGYQERMRLFALPASSWSDYDMRRISEGGGVFRRSAKSIPISPEIRDCLEIEATRLTPSELIAAILRAPVDMIWNGGIGTYVKASSETHASVGDKNNDAVRVDASALRCRVIGEAGNLGITQLGRVEFCRLGGRANTDFVDNAAGVNCSDHEVNIKILLSDSMNSGALAEDDRRQILFENTDAVEALVLADNNRQTLAISLAEAQSLRRMGEYHRFIRHLEARGKLNRQLEFIVEDEVLVDRKAQGKGLTRPELCVLICYAKAILKEDVHDSDLAHDEHIGRFVEAAFPSALRDRFRDEIHRHQLKREIVATQVANEIVNRMGFTFVSRLQTSTGASVEEVLCAYVATREIYDLEARFCEVESLDRATSTDAQYQLMTDLMRLARTSCRWFLRNRRGCVEIDREIERFAPGVAEITSLLPSSLLGRPRQEWQRRYDTLRQHCVSEDLARFAAEAPNLHACFALIEASESTGAPIHEVAEVYFSLGEGLDLEWLRGQIANLRIDNHWQALSRESLMDDLERQQRALTISVLQTHARDHEGSADIEAAIGKWQRVHAQNAGRWNALLGELHGGDSLDLTMCTVALRALLSWAEDADRLD